MAVLCVDDEPGMAELVGSHLERFDDRISATPATSTRQALDLLDTADFDCVVSEYDLPEMDGVVFLEAIRAERPELPFIIFTDRGSEAVASEAITAGVSDYVRRGTGTDQYQILGKRVTNAVSRYGLRREAVAAREQAETILRSSPDAILVGVDDECVYANPAAVSLLDVPDESVLLGDPVASFLRDEAAVQRDGAVVENARRFVTTRERETPVEMTARHITWDGEPGTVYVLRDVSDRVEYEREIEYRQSLLDSAFQASPDGILVTSPDGAILTYNDQFADFWGLSPELLDAADDDLALEAVRDRVADPEAFERNVEYQYDNPDETRRTEVRLRDGTVLDQYSTSVESADGTRHGFVWFYRDVTELKEMERARRRAFDRMTDAVYALNEDWEFTFLNERAERLLQRDADDLLGERLWTAFPEAVDTRIYEQFHEAAATNEPTSFELRYEPLAAEFEIRAFPSDTGLTVYFRNVTERNRTEVELEEAVAVLHQLYVVASNPDRDFESKLERILEFGTEYLGLPYGFMTEIADATQTVVTSTGGHELLQPGESCPIEESYCRKTIATEDGLLAVQDAAAAGWSDDAAYETFELGTYIGGRVTVNDDLYGTVCFAASDARGQDFSEMERTFVELTTRWVAYELEHREYQSQLESKNAQLEEFASVVSHDLRNPLNVAAGHVELAREECDSDHLPPVEQAHARMRRLIEDILTMAREGEVVDSMTAVTLRDVVESCWETVETRDATLDVVTDRTILADESRLTQLLSNLVRNAVEHGSTSGGAASSPAAAEYGGSDVTVTVGDLPDGFYVEDTGVGIPEDERANLFEAGYSTKSSGTGLGLRIVDRIASAHGWTVDVTASDAGGARFEFTGVEEP
ncbi:MAG: PAS domain S-box protein [Halobacterium sp.]